MEQTEKQSDKKRIFLLRLINFLHGAAGSTIGFNVLFLKTQGMDPGFVGFVMGLNALMGAVSPPIWGMLADRLQSKYRIFIYTIFGAAIVSILIPISAYISIAGVLLTTAMIPMMNFFRMPSMAILDTTTVTASTMVNGMDYSNVRYWMSIGWTMMSFAYSPLIDLFGVSFPFYAFVFFTAILFMCRKTLKQYDVPVEHEDGQKQCLQLSRLFKNYYLMVFIVINIFIMVGRNCGMMMPYMLSEIGANTSLVGTISGIRVTGEIVVLLLARRIRRFVPQPMMFILAVACSLTELITYQYASSFGVVAVAAAFGGGFNGFILSTGFNYVNDMAPEGLKATAICLYSMGGSAAGIFVNFIGGQIIALQGVRVFYLYAIGCLVLWLILFLGSYVFGQRVLKKEPPVPLFRRV